MLQPVEEMIFDSNSTVRYKNIFRHETELKWIKILQTPFPLGFNDNIYHQGNISKMPDFDVFSLLDIRRRNRRSRGKRKNGNLKRKHKNKTFWTLTDLWKILKSGFHQMLSKLSSLSIASLRKLDEEANKFYDSKHDLYHTALDVTLNMLFDHTLIRKLIILGTLSKYHSSIRVSISSIYLAYLEIILLNHLFLIILKIGNHLLFVINIINLLEVQYSISIKWLLLLILILRLQIHESVRIQNSVMNLQAILLQEI